MQGRLEQETITVIQIPIDRYPFAVTSSSPQHPEPPSKTAGASTTTTTSNTTSSVKNARDIPSPVKKLKHGDRTTSFAVGFQQLTASNGGVECLFFVENEERILLALENDIISVKILLASPHLGSLRPRVESVMKTLVQLRELVGSLSHCQDKVGDRANQIVESQTKRIHTPLLTTTLPCSI